ncbi:MAG TPA: hypothetical protein VGC18_02315 [Lacisediminihabitans sp.]|uniref:hypothetical protein n=1 Tax=Lacisediminihabitans sp. TaxID=2787631 RepID=UPI002ED9EECF
MSTSTSRITVRGTFAPAALAAVGILIVLVAQSLLGELFSALIYIHEPFDWLGAYLGQLWQVALPFSVGVLLGLWLIRPIVPRLRLMDVVLRSVLASGVGAALVLVVGVVLGLLGSIEFQGALFANSFPAATFSGSQAFSSVLQAVNTGIQSFIGSTPLVVLAGVLLWIPATRRSSGAPTAETHDGV